MLFYRYTKKKTTDGTTTIYAILLSWPVDSILKLGAPVPSPQTEVTMLQYPNGFKWVSGPSGQGIDITIPVIPWNLLPCDWAWVLKITNISN